MALLSFTAAPPGDFIGVGFMSWLRLLNVYTQMFLWDLIKSDLWIVTGDVEVNKGPGNCQLVGRLIRALLLTP